jgi:hypothetical protein
MIPIGFVSAVMHFTSVWSIQTPGVVEDGKIVKEGDIYKGWELLKRTYNVKSNPLRVFLLREVIFGMTLSVVLSAIIAFIISVCYKRRDGRIAKTYESSEELMEERLKRLHDSD